MKNILLILLFIIPAKPMAQTKKIIFVCEHGAAKSVIAAAYFNKMAKEKNLDYVAECRGTNPDEVVSPTAKEGLIRDKVFDPAVKPTKLLVADTANVKRFIFFTAIPPEMSSVKSENWSQTKNLDLDYENRRNAIIKKINELLDSLAKE